MRHPGRQAAEQGKVLHALRLLLQALTLGHFLVEGGGALRHALFELGRGPRQGGFGRPAFGEVGLRLPVELGILDAPGPRGRRAVPGWPRPRR